MKQLINYLTSSWLSFEFNYFRDLIIDRERAQILEKTVAFCKSVVWVWQKSVSNLTYLSMSDEIWTNMLLAGISSTLAQSSVHWCETIKTRLQKQGERGVKTTTYSGFLRGCARIIQMEGFFALYKGFSAVKTLLCLCPTGTLKKT